MEPQPIVVIGLKDVYDQVVGMRSNVQTLVHQQNAQEARSTDHETRIRALERGRWPLPALSVLIALAAAVTAAAALLTR